MIVAYHVIFATYGFWLPNDPRGSWSTFVGSWDIFRYGPATKTKLTRSLAGRSHDSKKRINAKTALMDPPVRLTGVQARAVGRGFGAYVRRSGMMVRACAILPDHVHLVFSNITIGVEQAVIQLKQSATQQWIAEGIHPRLQPGRREGKIPPCFVRGHWKVFLDPDDFARAIRYVERNPIKEGKPIQKWSFVTPL